MFIFEKSIMQSQAKTYRLDEFHYYSFMVSIDRRSCNTIEVPFSTICLPNKIEDVNLKVYNIIKGINQSKKLLKHTSGESKYKLDGKRNNDKCRCECEKRIKHRVCKEDYVWNTSNCGCEWDKNCEVREYLKNCTCIKSPVDDLAIMCDNNIDAPKSASINYANKNYWLIYTVLLAIM